MGIGDEAAPTLGNVKLPILLQYPQRFQFAIDGISAQPKQTRGLANVALSEQTHSTCLGHTQRMTDITLNSL